MLAVLQIGPKEGVGNLVTEACTGLVIGFFGLPRYRWVDYRMHA